MDSYSKLLIRIKALADADDFINTVSNKGERDLDLDKGNIFPILDVVVTGFSFPSEAVIRYSIELVCVDLRDINKEINADKFWDQDNLVDNMNEMMSSINRIWLNLKRDFNDSNITASESPTGEAIIYEGVNIYDGWRLPFDVDIPNTTICLT